MTDTFRRTHDIDEMLQGLRSMPSRSERPTSRHRLFFASWLEEAKQLFPDNSTIQSLAATQDRGDLRVCDLIFGLERIKCAHDERLAAESTYAKQLADTIHAEMQRLALLSASDREEFLIKEITLLRQRLAFDRIETSITSSHRAAIQFLASKTYQQTPDALRSFYLTRWAVDPPEADAFEKWLDALLAPPTGPRLVRRDSDRVYRITVAGLAFLEFLRRIGYDVAEGTDSPSAPAQPPSLGTDSPEHL